MLLVKKHLMQLKNISKSTNKENGVYEYKVVEAKNAKEAEKLMNKFAKEGWRVVSNTYWINFKAILIITFEKEIEAL